MPVAPDGQDGIEFQLNPGEQQGYASGLMPTGGPCFGGVLLYAGSERYAQPSWAFASTSTGPGIVFQNTFGDIVYDNPVFSAGGKRMVLSDPIYNGTYVSIVPCGSGGGTDASVPSVPAVDGASAQDGAGGTLDGGDAGGS